MLSGSSYFLLLVSPQPTSRLLPSCLFVCRRRPFLVFFLPFFSDTFHPSSSSSCEPSNQSSSSSAHLLCSLSVSSIALGASLRTAFPLLACSRPRVWCSSTVERFLHPHLLNQRRSFTPWFDCRATGRPSFDPCTCSLLWSPVRMLRQIASGGLTAASRGHSRPRHFLAVRRCFR